MPQVLIIDDQSISRLILEELIRSIDLDVTTESFADPVKALEWAKSNPVDLVITDFKMPQMDGVELIKWLRRLPRCSDIPVVIITCVEDKSVRYAALESGATDFLTKPIDHTECRARCQNLLTMSRQRSIIKERANWLEREIHKTTEALHIREQETLMRLAKAGEFRDECTGNHILRISRYSALIAQALRLSERAVELIERASPMHDIGKIAIPDTILLKRGRLSREEFIQMQRHSEFGYELLKDSPSEYLQTGAVIALSHHEKFDGSGYPEALQGEAIPIEARIVAIADVFDALVSDRPYKQSWSLDRALHYMKDERGRHFDPVCVEAFLDREPEVEEIHRTLNGEAIQATN